jgi:hypothetical protein
MKVPKQCSLVLRVEVHITKGKEIGSEEIKISAYETCQKQENQIEKGLYCLRQK